MKLQANNSIKVFLTELKNRIELLSGTKVTENIDNSNIDEIKSILSSYNILPSEAINPQDLKKISMKDLKKLLSLSGQNDDSIKYMISRLDEYCESAAKIISGYIEDFILIGETQAREFKSKIELYQKYIELFEQKEFKEPFEDINELSKVMAEIGLQDEDKWPILSYIAFQNSKTIEERDFNLSLRISNEFEKIEDYLSDEYLVSVLRETLEKKEIDIETIPTIASSLVDQTGLKAEILTNIIAVLIASNLLEKLKLMDRPKDQEDMITIINTVLSNVIVLDDKVIYEAESIKNERLDFYYNSLENGITDAEIKEYTELTLSEIESSGASREYAIDLKELTVLKPLIETLETVSLLDKTSQDYQKATNILKKLIEQYRILEEKKVNLIKE